MLALWLPILVSTAVLFFASFISWMVVRLHEKDWVKIDGEDQLIATVRELNLPEGNYMFPGADSAKEMETPEYQEKYKAGPRGILQVLPAANMARNLALTDPLLLFLQCDLRVSGQFCARPTGGRFCHRASVCVDDRAADVLRIDDPTRHLVQKPCRRSRDRIDRLCGVGRCDLCFVLAGDLTFQ